MNEEENFLRNFFKSDITKSKRHLIRNCISTLTKIRNNLNSYDNYKYSITKIIENNSDNESKLIEITKAMAIISSYTFIINSLKFIYTIIDSDIKLEDSKKKVLLDFQLSLMINNLRGKNEVTNKLVELIKQNRVEIDA